MNSSDYAKRIMLAVSKDSASIVLRTLLGLIENNKLNELPTEVVFLTTDNVKQRTLAKYCNGSQSPLLAICDRYGVDPIRFGEAQIRPFQDAEGNYLADLSSSAQLKTAADFILEEVKSLTSIEGNQITVSIADSEGPLSFYLGYALSMFGRPSDRLYHVLDNSPVNSDELELFHKHLERAGEPARFELLDIPFVRLRAELPENLLAHRKSFDEMVALLQRDQHEGSVKINLPGQELLIHDIKVKMDASHMAFYAWMALRRKNQLAPLRIPAEGKPDQAYSQDYLRIYRHIKGPRFETDERAEKALEAGMDKNHFESKKTRVNRMLRKHLGPHLADQYGINRFGEYGSCTFGLAIAPEQIIFK